MNCKGYTQLHKLSQILQNYTVGNPASVLYIKNLDKEVVADDFFYIFGELANLDACYFPKFWVFFLKSLCIIQCV
jgi:hypothetical protein